MSARRKADDGQPEAVDGPDDLVELTEVDRFGDVAVGVQVVRSEDVVFCRGRGEYDHRDASQRLVLFDLREHLPTILSRQIEVEENEIRTWCIMEPLGAAEKVDGLDPVGGDMQLDRRLSLGERLAGEADIAGVIFHQKDVEVPAARGN